MTSITLLKNAKILNMINDIGENLLGQNGEIGWQELWKLFTMYVIWQKSYLVCFSKLRCV